MIVFDTDHLSIWTHGARTPWVRQVQRAKHRGSEMPNATLEERVTELERIVAELVLMRETNGQAPPKDWRSTIGMFANDPIWEEIVEEGRKIREADRRRARRATGQKRTKAAKTLKTDRKRRSA